MLLLVFLIFSLLSFSSLTLSTFYQIGPTTIIVITLFFTSLVLYTEQKLNMSQKSQLPHLPPQTRTPPGNPGSPVSISHNQEVNKLRGDSF